MRYEVQLFLGERSRFDGDEDRKDYFMVVATIDLCVPSSEIKKLCDNHSGDPVYMYGADGNTRIVKDCYDHDLAAIPAETVLAAIKRANKGTGYPKERLNNEIRQHLESRKGNSATRKQAHRQSA